MTRVILFGMKSIVAVTKRGFTLVEILVVITILTLIISVIGVNAIQSGQKSRDAKRQADLALLQNAIELYKNKNGEYPLACKGANTWSGQQGTDYACPGGSAQYIVGLAPEFIPVLPQEKKLNGTNSGYIYRVNGNGTVYKLKAHRTVESEVVTYTHEFKPCDIRVTSNPSTGGFITSSQDIDTVGWCGSVRFDSLAGDIAPLCRFNTEDWQISYGVWGGIAPLRGRTTLAGLTSADHAIKSNAVEDTATVICR